MLHQYEKELDHNQKIPKHRQQIDAKQYALEKEAKELTPDERYLMRQEKAKPIMEKFGDWLWETYPQTPPKGLLGKAIKYT